MNVTEVLQFADELVFQQTGKHLDNSQEVVVKGVWQGKTYEEIADQSNRSERYIRDVGYKLWQILSEQLGEDIHKSNFQSTFKRLHISSSPTQNICNVTGRNNNSFNYNPLILYNSPEEHQKNDTNTQSKSIYHDFKLAPKITKFCDRTQDLTKLDNAIAQNTPLISVLGLSGIGKTTLVKRFVDLNLDQFEVIIWRSLKYPKSLDLLINDFLNVCKLEPKETLDDKLTQLFDILTDKKCLIILDDVQNIFISGDFAGKYKPEYQDYQNFFTMITETKHKSNVIVISQEQCPEIICLDEDLHPINSIELSGLDDVDILQNTGLKNEEHWLKLIKLYEGNPFYLKTVVKAIKNIFDGNVNEFLDENELIITKDMQSNLQLLFNRLSPIEKQILLKLSKFDQPVSREELKTSLELSSTDFINGLDSLQQRYILTKIKADKTMFKLDSVFREYVRNCFKD